MNKTEEEVVDIIEDVVRYYRDWQDGERESTSKSRYLVYSVNHLNAINNLSSQMTNLGKEMSAIKAKLESATYQVSSLPSQSKGRGMSSNSQPLPLLITCLVDACFVMIVDRTIMMFLIALMQVWMFVMIKMEM